MPRDLLRRPVPRGRLPRRFVLLTTGSASVVLSALIAAHAAAATANAQATAQVTAPAQITITATPNLGQLDVTGAGSVTLAPTGNGISTTGSFQTAGGFPQSGGAVISQSEGTIDFTLTMEDLTDNGNRLQATSAVIEANVGTFSGSAPVNDGLSFIRSTTTGVVLTGTTSPLDIGLGFGANTNLPNGTYQGVLTLTVQNT